MSAERSDCLQSRADAVRRVIETSARLLRLLAVLQSQPDLTGPEVASRLGVTTRTVRRDVEKLRALGYQVDSQTGAVGGYRLGRGSAMPPLLLDDEETLAIVVSLRTATVTGLLGVEEVALRALVKLDQLLPARLRRRVDAIVTSVSGASARGPQVEAETLLRVAAAVRDGNALRIVYRRGDGQESRRTVEPHHVVHSGSRWYLLAYDIYREGWRTLRLDRMVLRTPDGGRFAPRPLPATDPVAYVLSQVNSAPYQLFCSATVDAPAERVEERLSSLMADIEARGPQSCRVSFGLTRVNEAASRLISLDAPFVVHEPPELVAHLAVVGARLAASLPGEADAPTT